MSINVTTACLTIAKARNDAVLVGTMTAHHVYDDNQVKHPRLDSVPLMGGAPSLALGMAIACPQQKVIVVDGDASLLMQLGGLATVVDQAPANFYHFVLHNGTQFSSICNLPIPAQKSIDFAGVAKSVGYRTVHRFDDPQDFAAKIDGVLASEGPVFVELIIDPGKPVHGVTLMFEIPDTQYKKMGRQMRALTQWYRERADAA
ncbi:MAG: thiamine pyrophosphate-binding protein [Burkholderiales bacterium]|nr:thiamine pyrophosphate-binding protein [Burkholderiales bacterium]MBK8665741.1 thiamine pyrophosphate-binding protein [Burkholderiales bacterium]